VQDYEGVALPAKRRVRKVAKKRPAARLRAPKKAPGKADRKVRITERDPCLVCGKDTSVERVFRVEEREGKARAIHLVFFDRHGWYCEHGALCAAVSDVKRFIRHSR
jgi:hypothetical protein